MVESALQWPVTKKHSALEKHRLTKTCHRLKMMVQLVLLVLKCLGNAKRHARVSNMSRLVVDRCRCQSMQKNHKHNCIRCLRVDVGPFVRSLKSGSPVSHRLCYPPPLQSVVGCIQGHAGHLFAFLRVFQAGAACGWQHCHEWSSAAGWQGPVGAGARF